MKVGDLVKLKNLDESWGKVGLITKIHVTDYGLGQIYMITGGNLSCTIPWLKRCDFIVEADLNESR